jgi:hypothetical protein
MTKIYAEHWVTFHLDSSGRWQIAMWQDAARPVAAKLYRLRIKVPAELVGETQATVDDTEKKERR